MDDLPSSHYHSPVVREFNRANAGRFFDLSESALVAQACAEAGVAEAGNDPFRPALQVLLDAVAAEADLNPFGRANVQSRVVRSLKNRYWAEQCFAAHPEIRQRKIVAPIVIVGPHRSGTTRLQRMLATDSRLRYLKTWEGINPSPRLNLPAMGAAERRSEAEAMLALGQEAYAQAFVAHPMHVDWPEEEMLLLNHLFCSFSLFGMFQVPGYYRWFMAADKTETYRYMADLLRLISWAGGEGEEVRWVLKNPQHMLDLDALLSVFPDAKLVFTHRDPLKTVGSMMSLVWFYAVQHTDRNCRASIRDVWLDFCEQSARRCMAARERIPEARRIDIQYADVNNDWRGAMRQIYEFAGEEYTPAAERAQADWLAHSERERHHGGHHYDLADFGVDDAEVDRRMMFVRDHYRIPREGR